MVKSIVPMHMIGILHKYMNYIKRFLISLMLLFSLVACNATSMFDYFTKPALLDLRPPPGPPDYQAAFVDGCATASQENNQNILALHGKGMYMNADMNNKSPIYRSMWRSVYIYCGLWIPYQSRNRMSFFKADWTFQVQSMPWTKKHNLLHDAPPGPYAFREGWKEGCITGKAATGQSHHKMVYTFIKSAKWIEGDHFNPAFEKGWQTAFWWCQRYYDIMVSPDRKSFL
jgi:hypothetical protein